MLSYFTKRIGLAFITLFVIMLICYALIRCAPGDPTKGSIFGEAGTLGEGVSAKDGLIGQNLSIRKKLHLDKPMLVGFAYWLKGIILHGDFGDSASVDRGRPVSQLIMERLPVTLRLNICAILVTYLLSIPIGIHSAITRNKKVDQTITFVLFMLYSLPSFWVALLLQALICQGGEWPLFPLKGLTPDRTWGLSSWQIVSATALHYVLPVFCLCYAGFARLSRYARASMLEVVKQDYIRTARAKGLSEVTVVLKHAFRNSLIVQITLFALLIPGLVTGSIIVEHVFSIPGMGKLSVNAMINRDIPVLMALFAISGILTLSAIMLADALYVLADPRIDFESSARQ